VSIMRACPTVKQQTKTISGKAFFCSSCVWWQSNWSPAALSRSNPQLNSPR